MRALFALALVAAGCGIGSYNDFRDQLATRWCARQIKCGEVGATESQQRCSTPAPLLLTQRGAVDVLTSISDHRMIFHPANAQECLDAVKDAPCDPAQANQAFVAHCHGVVTAGASSGSVCWGDDECVGGRCVNPDCGGTCTPFALPGGMCVPRDGGPGETCDPSVHFCSGDGVCFHKESQGGPCAADEQCLFDFVCVDGKCDDAPRVKKDDVCGTDTPPCEDGLYCDETGACEPLKAPGDACVKPDACQAGMDCIGGLCAPWLDVGSACTVATPAIESGCPATQTCTRAACTPVPDVKAGPLAHCDSDADCDVALYCAAGGYCYYVGGINAVCQSDHECAQDLQCLSGACHVPGYLMCAPAM